MRRWLHGRNGRIEYERNAKAVFLVFMLIIAAFWGSSFAYPEKEKAESLLLEQKNTDRLKGILALIVMEGHIVKFGDFPGLFFLDKAGVLMVGIFFFLSGYGVMYGMEHKSNYLQGFLGKRILSVLIPCYLLYLLNYGRGLFGTGAVPENFIKYVLGRRFLDFLGQYWFVWVILLLYVLFYLLFRFIEKRWALAYLTGIVAALLTAGYGVQFSRVYWGGALCFPLGIYAAQKKSVFLKYFTGKKGAGLTVLLAVMLGVASIFYFVGGEYSFWGDLVGRNVATLAAAMLAVYFLLHVNLDNPFNRCLSKIYWEIYIVHIVLIGAILNIGFFKIHQNYYAMVVISGTVLTAFMLNKISRILMKAVIKR